MPQTIARMYSRQETAEAVVKELQERGIVADDIVVVTRPAAAQSESPETTASPTTTGTDPILASIMETGVPPAHASIYAERVRQGDVLVAVCPPFGYGLPATQIMDSHDPIAVDLPEAAPVGPGTRSAATSGAISGATPGTTTSTRVRDDATPLSSALGLRVLLSDPAPLSNYLNWRTLKPEPNSSTTLESIRRQSNDAAPLSGKVGMSVLSDNPAPLSNKAGWRTLSPEPAPLSRKLGWRLLSDDPAPLSNKLGWRVLLDNPTPLSSLLGLKVLSKD